MSSTPQSQGRSRQNSLRFKLPSVATTELSNEPISATLSPTTSNTNESPMSKYGNNRGHTQGSTLSTPISSSVLDSPSSVDKDLRHNLFGKVTGLLHKSLLSSQDIMSSSDYESDRERDVKKDDTKAAGSAETQQKETLSKEVRHKVSDSTLKLNTLSQRPSTSSLGSNASMFSPTKLQSRSVPLSRTDSPVKETNRIFIEYDPITKRKVLNTYEILGEIGRGEHGKVKLARDLVMKELVAIKIVNRKKKERPSLRMRGSKNNYPGNEYEMKIKREIAIMKKCNHKHIVSLKEVLDDANTHKIYLVLEYLEKGEIKWKRVQQNDVNLEEIPCCGTNNPGTVKQDDPEIDLLSNEYSPNLTFKQSRKIFRDVLLGLEYLHLQGIVHRDIKPANLLVSSDNVVKISDFGVSFASSLDDADAGLVNELELAKTAGTPAFFAPELCQTNFSSSKPNSRNSSFSNSRRDSKSTSASSLEVLRNELTLTKVLPKIDYKIDIWALGVTLYCLLFGRLPFNAESEFDLFQVIVNQQLEFPQDKDSFNSPTPVSEAEFELAKDLLSKLLDKNSASRIELKDIKEHPFVLLDLDDDLDALNELLYLNDPSGSNNFLSNVDVSNPNNAVTKEDIDNAIVGIGSRIKRSIVRAIASGAKDHDIRRKFSSSMEQGGSYASTSSSDEVPSPLGSERFASGDHSVILSESQNYYSGMSRASSEVPSHGHFHVPSHLSTGSVLSSHAASPHASSGPPTPSAAAPVPPSLASRNSSYTLAGYKDGRFANPILNEVIESTTPSSSRRGSTSANEIETKRNVAGDLYLRNQSVVDTFKGIQEMDNKRRRSSAFSNVSTSTVPKNSVPNANGPTVSEPPVTQPVLIPGSQEPKYDLNERNLTGHGTSQIIIGPIADNLGRRQSSSMSIPLTESFASLDSINDDYLNAKYQEYTLKKEQQKQQQGESDQAVESISEQFSNFNMADSMNPSVSENKGISFNFAKRTHVLDEVAPKTIVTGPSDIPRVGTTTSLSSSCSSYTSTGSNTGSESGSGSSRNSLEINVAPRSHTATPKPSKVESFFKKKDDGANRDHDSGSDSDSDSDSDSGSEEDGNLTLAFQSRVGPARPKFLSLDQRAKSHDSSLASVPKAKWTSKYVPVVIPDQQDLEDIPVGLISSVPRPSVSLAPNPTGDTVSSDPSPVVPVILNSPGSNDGPRSTSTIIQSQEKELAMEREKVRCLKPFEERKHERRPSPLVNNAPFSELATTNSHLYAPNGNTPTFNASATPLHQRFNNHYKKDPISFPFPNAIHSDMDKESKGKTVEKQSIREQRPHNYRSNSITIGLLQHNQQKYEE